MSQTPTLLSPRSRRQSKYRDIDISLSVNPLNNDLSVLNDNQSIHQSVKLLVMTAFYEKWFRPKIGNFIPSAIFELPSSMLAFEIQNSVSRMLQNYEPRIVLRNGLDDVIVEGLEEDRNQFTVTIRYIIKGQIGENFTRVYVDRTK